MASFAHFYQLLNEAKFRDIPDLVVSGATRVAESYIEQTSNMTDSKLKRMQKLGLNSGWKTYFEEMGDNVWFATQIDKVKFKDLRTNKPVTYKIYIAFGENNENYALCDNLNKMIILYDDNCKNLQKDKLILVLIHEITHGFQQHKGYSSKYKKLVDTKSPEAKLAANSLYHKEPIEFDAFTTEISHAIKTEYQKIKNNIANSRMPETKKIMERKLEKFLLELKLFIQSPLDTYFIYKELSLPTSLHTFEEMLSSIQQSPKLWKSFKSKLLNLYNQLTK